MFLWDKVFLFPPIRDGRHASIRTLEERIVSLGARWAFSFQPVLPSDWRPVVSLKEWNVGQAINAVTGTRLWLFVFLSGTVLTRQQLPESEKSISHLAAVASRGCGLFVRSGTRILRLREFFSSD